MYLLREAFTAGVLQLSAEPTTWCEFKGTAQYLDIVCGQARADRAAWTYPAPTKGYELLTDLVAVYPGRMQRCTVDGEVVTAQQGDFYGGWLTSRICGPFKGGAGTSRW